MTDTAIRISNLSKCYQIYDNQRDRLKQFIAPPVATHGRANPQAILPRILGA